MNILITGGAGFIGSRLAIKLSKEHNITIVDNLIEQVHGNKDINFYIEKFSKFNIKFIYSDINNINSTHLENIDIIYHLAADTGTGQSMYEINRYVKNNVMGLSNIMEIIIKNKIDIKKIIIASSRAIYGEGSKYCNNEDLIVSPKHRLNEDLKTGNFKNRCPSCNKYSLTNLASEEDFIANPVSIYGSTKYANELMLKNFNDYTNIPYVIARPQNVYGPGQSINNPYTGIISIFGQLIKENKEIEIYEDGNQLRDFIYIDDVVNLFFECAFNDRVNNQTINFGTGNRISVKELVNIMQKIYKNTRFKISGKYRIGDIRDNYAHTYKLKNLFDYRVTTNIKTGIENTLNWINEL